MKGITDLARLVRAGFCRSCTTAQPIGPSGMCRECRDSHVRALVARDWMVMCSMAWLVRGMYGAVDEWVAIPRPQPVAGDIEHLPPPAEIVDRTEE